MKIDVHQHLWSEPLVEALAVRRELPFVRQERGLTVLYLAGERPYVIDCESEEPARRATLVEHDGLDWALLCLSSPIGIEGLARRDSAPLLEAYLDGALAIGSPFGVWGAIALDRPDPDDVDRVLDRGCIGLSLPAGAIGGVDELAGLRPVLQRLESRDAPLFVHPGPGRHTRAEFRPQCGSLNEPLWWPALTDYVAGLQSAWLAFLVAGRAEHPNLRVVFSMLAGLAPLHRERLSARGGPGHLLGDPSIFYETSSYGHVAVRALAATVGAEQLLYGSDRPVVEPRDLASPQGLDWSVLTTGTTRALGAPSMAVAR
jgi:hypothetical protein